MVKVKKMHLEVYLNFYVIIKFISVSVKLSITNIITYINLEILNLLRYLIN
jgi:hypothetical protein